MRSSYIVDASVAVQWIHSAGEQTVREARSFLQGGVRGDYRLVSSALLPYELFNALIRGKGLSGSDLKRAADFFFRLPIELASITEEHARTILLMAERHALTFYDASYAALAFERGSPLVSADRRQLGAGSIEVFDIARWPTVEEE